ncbi:DDB1- and CUL4-associated factor 6-like [Scaptodrosophila lebanonensis]|uniref:DDB1- and CUL4-associated factor 6-like n=1 Tax=Drosophila lebanonensis TaxID=7225 RepID=A0A6J2UDV0_DROLE|nr:DDB1- and CUL4-associated factor 6-like [Scaptodrosophila lebanonensis]XP_030386544.1 DDB1- and CUL4-associated factor 6-like [Scaptodrosophila lebanonensis]
MDDAKLRRSVYKSIDSFSHLPAGQAQGYLQASLKNSLDYVQRLALMDTLKIHNGCVNTVNWNASGTYLVSGADDNHLVITDAKNYRVALKSPTKHKRHIFSARFMPNTNDQAVISCSGEGLVIHTEFLTLYGAGKANVEEALIKDQDRHSSHFSCQKYGTTYDVLPLTDNPRTFISCGEDCTVRCFDLRISSKCASRVCTKHAYIVAPTSITAMDVSPVHYNLLAAGCTDSIIRIYDRRMLGTPNTTNGANGVNGPEATSRVLKAYPIPMEYTHRHYRPTCVKFSPNESELLISYSMDHIYLYDLKHPGYSDAKLLKSDCYTDKVRREDAFSDPNQEMPRLRFRGDWSDTGPNSMPPTEGIERPNIGQARPSLTPNVLSRLSDEIIRMINSHSRLGRTLALRGPRAVEAFISNLENRAAAANRGPPVREVVASPELELAERPAGLAPLRNGQGTEKEAESFGLIRAAKKDDNGEGADEGDGNNDEPNDNEEGEDGQKYPITEFNYVIKKFTGHRNSRTMVKGASFWGDDFIMSGSDCGHIFIWNRHTAKVVKILVADNRVVNRVQPHPTLPYLASSGIDYNVKLWAPIEPTPRNDDKAIVTLMKSNEIMLEEARSTITVPAPVMIRVLANMHQSRQRANSDNAPPNEAQPAPTPEEAVAREEETAMAGSAATAGQQNVANDDEDDNNGAQNFH